MISNQTLIALQFKYETKSLEENFETLKNLLNKTPKNSIILAPELCLSGYNYDDLDSSALFSKKFIPTLCKLSKDKTFAMTLIEKHDGNYFNNLKIFNNGELIYTRSKVKLFALGNEQKYFTGGNEEDIKIIEINGIKIAILVCFELRFTNLWQQLLGADIILVPSYWGKLRKEHFEALTKALAIANQTFVIASNSSDESMGSGSGIITPFGKEYRDDAKDIISQDVDFKEIIKMRKYINIGL